MSQKHVDLDRLTIRAPRRRERKALIEMTATVFEAPPGSGRWERFCRTGYLDGSCYDWDSSRIAVADGRIVGHLGIWGHRRRIGKAALRSAGLGAVSTLEAIRGAGVGRRIMEAVLAAVEADGYDISVMAGIAKYYCLFGWAPCWGEWEARIQTADLPEASSTWRRRRAPLTRMIRAEGAVGRIYRRENRLFSCAAVRPLFTKDHRHWRLEELLDPRGRVRAYMATEVHDEALLVRELGGWSTSAGRWELLRSLRAAAEEVGCREVRLPCGPDHPLAGLLRRLSCAFNGRSRADGGHMVRIINLHSTLRKMASELTARLSTSALAGKSGALTLETPHGRAMLKITRGRVAIADAPVAGAPTIGANHDIARLIVGADDPRAIIDAGRFRCSRQAHLWAEALFPARPHQYLPADGY